MAYIFRGPPGSGKTTHAHRMSSFVVEPDMFRYNAEMKYVFDSERNREVVKKADDLLTYGMRHLKMPTVAIAATHVKMEHVRKYVAMAKKYGYSVSVVECYGNYGSLHDVPDAVVAKMMKDFEPISNYEAHELGVGVIRIRKGE